VKIFACIAIAAAVVLASPGFSQAQQAPKAKTPPPPSRTTQATPSPTPAPQAEAAPPNTPAPPGWVARCSSVSRDAPLECAVWGAIASQELLQRPATGGLDDLKHQ